MLPVPYLLTVSVSHRFVYYQVPKCATRTIDLALEDTNPTPTNRKIRVLYLAGRYRNFYRFAFVRNPWDRLVSAWANKVRDHNRYGFDTDTLEQMQDFRTFARWVSTLDIATAERHIRSQTSLIDLKAEPFVGHLETFDADFAAVCERIGVNPPMVVVGATKRADFRSYYDSNTAALVGRIYAEDIEAFGYQDAHP